MWHAARLMLGGLLAAAALAMGSGVGVGAGAGPAGGAAAGPQLAQSPAPAEAGGFGFVPPPRGQPSRRVGGGTRGGPDELHLAVLTPEDEGLTSQAQPVLYWFASAATAQPVELVVTAVDAIDPILDVQVPGPAAAGITRIALADHRVRLEPGRSYLWTVTVVEDSLHASRNPSTSGGLRRVDLPADLASQLRGATPERRAALYAQAGLWYDALDALSQAIAASPQPAALRGQRAAWLEQVGLTQAAAFDHGG